MYDLRKGGRTKAADRWAELQKIAAELAASIGTDMQKAAATYVPHKHAWYVVVRHRGKCADRWVYFGG